MKAAQTLVGSYAHLRPDNPQVFIASIASVLAQYPLGIVQEASDPRVGIARKVEFLSVKALVEWCDARLAHYQAFASYVARPRLPVREFTQDEEAMGRDAVRGLARAKAAGTLTADMTFEQAVDLGKDEAAA